MSGTIKFFDELSSKQASRFEWVFADIDDTITTDGKLSREAYGALWDLKNSNRRVVLVTGRPAGWAESMARFWPIDAIVCENGALIFSLSDSTPSKMQRIYVASEAERERSQKKLQKLWGQIQKELPHIKLAADQSFRLFDLAIDLCEDVVAVSKKDTQKIVKLIESHKLEYKISSIHINVWAGDYSKRDGIERALKEIWAADLNSILGEALYFGDSPNDEPLFECFKHSVGVRNVEKFLPSMDSKPSYLTRSKEGRGFSEAVQKILQS